MKYACSFYDKDELVMESWFYARDKNHANELAAKIAIAVQANNFAIDS